MKWWNHNPQLHLFINFYVYSLTTEQRSKLIRKDCLDRHFNRRDRELRGLKEITIENFKTIIKRKLSMKVIYLLSLNSLKKSSMEKSLNTEEKFSKDVEGSYLYILNKISN